MNPDPFREATKDGQPGRGSIDGKFHANTWYRTKQCCGSGMFYPGSEHLFPDPESASGSKHFFILDLGSYMKGGMDAHFFLASYGFRSKILVLVTVNKIRDPAKNSSRIQE
jgi:hypothetical protein